MQPVDGQLPSRRLAHDLRAAIASGDLAPGAKLPSERTLAAQHRVARNTVREAVRLLSEEGLVTAAHGKGVVHVLAPLDELRTAFSKGVATHAGIGKVEVFSTLRACPVCATSYPELDPRLFSYNSKHGWCPDCVRTGVRLTREQRKLFEQLRETLPAENEPHEKGIIDRVKDYFM